MAAELEVRMNAAIGRKKSAGLTPRFETQHLSFSSLRRLMRYFRSIIQIAALPVFGLG
jgi:hypothetical protein